MFITGIYTLVRPEEIATLNKNLVINAQELFRAQSPVVHLQFESLDQLEIFHVSAQISKQGVR